MLGWVTTINLPAQAVNSVNFNYLYNLQAEVDLKLQLVNIPSGVDVYYLLKSSDAAVSTYLLEWEKKDSYSQRVGGMINPKDSVKMSNGIATGHFRFDRQEKPWVLMVKVKNPGTGKSWYFSKQVELHYPVNGFLEKDGSHIFQSYIDAGGQYIVRGSGTQKSIHFSYYKDNFPTPSPPFADKELKMDRFLFPDSTFVIQPGQSVGPFSKEGLYLGQEDTLSAEGFSFMVRKAPYPKYNKLADLKGPLLFVTTREENDLIGAAGEEKAKFDKVILDITNDKERAKNFMRNYFKRVEFANTFFTSFKEGWKTDKGMIFIIFGAPDEVQITGQQEIWRYKNPRQSFTFNKAGSVYAPEHFVLVRDKNYTENWYLTIDLWRKSRF